MTDRAPDQQPDPEEVPGAQASGADEGEPTAEFVVAEGPDVEAPGTDEGVGFSEADEAFLQNVSSGAAQPAPAAEPEHLADLRRVTAEYANYRRRVERERVVERERAVGDAARAVLPVLDDLDRAEAHGDLAEGGPLTTIAQKLRAQVTKLGVVAYAERGETFDPHQHDAIFQRVNPEVSRPTVSDVVERGYRIGDTVLRVAKVVVDTPSEG
jgi:molecular chaperone GrpE